MKQTSVIWTNEALNDLLALEDYLEATHTTERTIDRILARAEQLASFPESGQKQQSLTQQDYRYLVEGKYKLIYSYRHHLYPRRLRYPPGSRQAQDLTKCNNPNLARVFRLLPR